MTLDEIMAEIGRCDLLRARLVEQLRRHPDTRRIETEAAERPVSIEEIMVATDQLRRLRHSREVSRREHLSIVT